jgi:hypothetical protein
VHDPFMVHVCILAGASRKAYIHGKPKCFLDLPTGESTVEEILREIDPIKTIESIVIIGPQEGLNKLTQRKVHERFKHKIGLVPQGKTIQDNFILAKQAILAMNKIKDPKKAAELGILYLLGDTPFRQQCAVEEFITQIHGDKDLVISWVAEEHIQPYYHYFKKPMIPIFMHGLPGNYKETNMVFFNPDKLVGNLTKRFYRLRHTSRLSTMIELYRLMKKLKGGRLVNILLHLVMVRQWHKTFRRIAPRSVHTPRFFYKRLDKDVLCTLVDDVFGIKADVVISSYPDGYMDIDTALDYKKIYTHYFDLLHLVTTDCMRQNSNKKPHKK